MEYKGYIAEYEYDELDKLYSGRVINSGPYSIVTFVSSDPDGLMREFQISIDEYLAWCAEDGVERIKPISTSSTNAH